MQRLRSLKSFTSLHALEKRTSCEKKVRYAYQEWPHPADTASPHSQKVERRRQHGYTIISFKIDVTNN